METQFTVIGEQNKFKVKKSSKNKIWDSIY